MTSRRLAAALDDLRRAEPEALLEDLGRVHRRAGVLRADVEPVRARGGEADELAVVEDRPEDRDVVQVGAGEVRVVHDPDVAGLPGLAAVHLLGHARADLEVAEEDRQPGRLAEHAVARRRAARPSSP